MSKFGDVANAIVSSVGQTHGEMVVKMAKAAYPEGHPEILFAEWVMEHQGRLRAACIDLGLVPPESGPDLYQRLKDLVMPELEHRAKEKSDA